MNFSLYSKKKKITVTIDKCDWNKISNYTWWLKDNGYVYTQIKKKTLYLHRFLMGLDYKNILTVDHINGNKLDNRRCNLRVVSHRTNVQNKNRICGIRKRKDKFVVRISWRDFNNKKREKHYGVFSVRKEAIKARMQAEIDIFGQISNLEVFNKELCKH